MSDHYANQSPTPDDGSSDLIGRARHDTNPYLISPQNAPVPSELDGIHCVDDEVIPADLVDRGPSQPVRKIGYPMIAWIVIIVLVSLMALRPFLIGDKQAVEEPTGQDSLAARMLEIQGKYFVGASEFPTIKGEQLYKNAEPLNNGPLSNRFCFIVLAGELSGAAEAIDQLELLQDKLEANQTDTTDEHEQIHDTLASLYSDYNEEQWTAPSVDPSQREFLKRNLGWFGALALAPATGPDRSARTSVMGPARWTFVVVFLAALAVFGMGAAGLALLVIFVVMVYGGKVRSRLVAGSRHGGVYAETFALWMVLFIALSVGASLLAPERHLLAVNLLAFLFSLFALQWPVIRGISWRRVRKDVGLTTGNNILLEPVWGFICYISTLPLLLIGVLVMLMLMSIAALLSGGGGGDEFAATSFPAHPIVNWIGEAGWWGRLQILLLACLAAPIVEETMFRGVLYRHLRDSTAFWRIGLSVLFSGVLSSFIFAVIHPQGIFAVPALMALAFGFAIAREWRGSLLAPMTMHALNNGLATLLMLAIL